MRATGALLLLIVLGGCETRPVEAPVQQAGQAVATPANSTVSSSEQNEPVPSDSANDPAADEVRLSVVSYDGILERIEAQRGKVIVMDAWSTSCVPCMKEFHHLVELHHKYGPEKLACMSLSFDYEGLDSPEEVQPPVIKFLRAQGATFENLISNEESDVLYRKFKLGAVPAVFVYDRAGQLRKRFDNQKAKTKAEAFTYEQVGQLVAELLAEPTPDQVPAAPDSAR